MTDHPKHVLDLAGIQMQRYPTHSRLWHIATALMTPPPEPPVDPRVAVVEEWFGQDSLSKADMAEFLRLLDMVKEAGHG